MMPKLSSGTLATNIVSRIQTLTPPSDLELTQLFENGFESWYAIRPFTEAMKEVGSGNETEPLNKLRTKQKAFVQKVYEIGLVSPDGCLVRQ